MLCPNCKKREKQKHWNSKWCLSCALERKKRPRSTLSKSQIAWVRRRVGKIPVEEMARELGTSVANVKRAFRGKSLWFQNGKYKNQPELVKQVLSYYAKHGRRATEAAFPRIRVRSVVERARYYGVEAEPRQVRWTREQIRELAQMAGLVSMRAQARFFDRPNTKAGSIRSVWMKRFGMGGGMLNGLSWCVARDFVGPRCRPIRTAYWSSRNARHFRGPHSRKLVLWCDLEKHLKADVPAEIRRAISAAARVQRWLHGVQHVKPRIIRLIEVREAYGKRS